LFGIMCLSSQYQQLTSGPAEPNPRIHTFHERTVHCLVLGHFTKGGPHVLETMIIHCTSELLVYKDAEIGLWLLLGMIVQLALSMGYHRDPSNFSHLSLFAGEMRRRVWAAIVQIDLRLSSQMGLPRLLKSQQSDTAEPRNLLDSDLTEESIELPPSRPETEVTPVLYGLAKTRIDRIGALISDLIADVRAHHHQTLPEIMHLDTQLHQAEASLPIIFQWQPLNQSLTTPPQIVLHRLVCQLATQRLAISLHRRYLSASYASDERYSYSRNACVQAAIKILEFQRIVYEEAQPDGLLYPMRRLRSSLMQSIFLLGMSVLSYYYAQVTKSATDDAPLDVNRERVLDLLRDSYPMWVRESAMSYEAQKAVEHLRVVLGHGTPLLADESPVALSHGQDAWDDAGYAGFAQVPFDADPMAWDMTELSVDLLSTNWLLH
jgi:Fungal specific transcription factor domain